MVANIRGGGEFGPKWHQAAIKANRQQGLRGLHRSRGRLDPAQGDVSPRLGTEGRSNGGLLMGNMLTRRPDLFGAIVCGSPLLDMKRYNQLLAGASWMGEYGNPDVPRSGLHLDVFALPQRQVVGEIPSHALHVVNPRRSRPPRPRAKDGGQDARARPRRGVL